MNICTYIDLHKISTLIHEGQGQVLWRREMNQKHLCHTSKIAVQVHVYLLSALKCGLLMILHIFLYQDLSISVSFFPYYCVDFVYSEFTFMKILKNTGIPRWNKSRRLTGAYMYTLVMYAPSFFWFRSRSDLPFHEMCFALVNYSWVS